MRKWIWLALFVGGISLAQAGLADSSILSVSGANRWYPYSYRVSDGSAHGVGYDLLTKLMASRDVRVVTLPDKPWGRMFAETAIGNSDALSALYKTAGRAEKLWITTPFARDNIRVFVVKGHEFDIKSMRDLEGHIGVRPAQGSYGEEFDAFAEKKLTFRQVIDVPTQLKALADGQADYVVYAEFDGQAKIKKLGYEGKIVPVGPPIATADVCLGLSHKRFTADQVKAINREIERMRRDGTIDRLIAFHKEQVQ